MKKLFFSICLCCIVAVAAAQPKILSPSQVYRQVVKSTVTIVTDAGSLGSGFYVAPNVIATNYHVVEGASSVKCVLTNTTKQVSVTGYVAVDKNADLILLKVTGAPKSPLKLAHGKVATGQIIYAIGAPQGMEGTISDGIVSAVRSVEHITLVQITAPISQGSSGGPVVNRVGEVVGISTLIHTGGQNLNFAVSYTHLQKLIARMKLTPTKLAYLHERSQTRNNQRSSSVYNNNGGNHEPNYYDRNKVLEIGIYRRGSPELTLDALINVGGYSVFAFTYKHKNSEQLYQPIWMESYRLVDIETGDVYYAAGTDLPNSDDPRIIYNNTQSSFSIWFNRLPRKVKRISLMEENCPEPAFCFLNVNLDDYSEVTNFDFSRYEDTREEGTVAFYTDYGSSGNTKIYVEGYYIGELTKYFENKSYTPQCGEDGTLTVRLNAGTYNYTASDNKYNWEGQVTVTKNGCTTQKLIVE
jgi:hypothetical protein